MEQAVCRRRGRGVRRPVGLSFALGCVAMMGLLAPRAVAWGNKEHIQLTRIAAARLIAATDTPPAMKDWLRKATPGLMTMEEERRWFLTQRIGIFPRGVDGLPFWATVPDMAALSSRESEKVEPFGVHERLLHFIDLEFFHPDGPRRRYTDDLSGKPRIEDIPRAMHDPRYQRAGMLPFRVEQVYRELVECLRAGWLVDRPGQHPRDHHATKWAGYLAHYVQDNTQPHHSTVDYRSASYFGNRRDAPNVHADLEYRLGDDEYEDYPELREEFWRAFVKALEEVEDPIQTPDLWRATVEVSMTSYDALPLIGAAARAAYPAGNETRRAFDAAAFFRHKGQYQGREMTLTELKARQMAWAVKRTEKLWLRAWKEAEGEMQNAE